PGGDIVADADSRQVLIGNQFADGTVPDGFASLHSSHSTGSLHFADDGSLIATHGDGAHFDVTDGGGLDPAGFETFTHPVTGLKGPRPVDQDSGAFRAQDLRSLSGKVLRVDPETGWGYPSNPFFDGNPRSNASKVWALGLRNPFRVNLVPGTGSSDPDDGLPNTIVIGDVGWNDREELNVCRGGENFGWPCFEGPVAEPSYQAYDHGLNTMGFPQCDAMGPGPLTDAALAWDHDDPAAVAPPGLHVDEEGNPASGFVGSCAIAGAVYAGGQYPPVYDGRVFVADYADEWIKAMLLDEQGALVEVRDFASGVGGVVDLQPHPLTGDIHFLTLGGPGEGGKIFQIRFAGNLTPTAVAGATPDSGDAPLLVDFDGSRSSDPEGGPLTFEWDFADGSPLSTEQDPQHTYLLDGIYEAKLTVTDDAGLSSADSVQVAVGFEPPVAAILSPLPGQTFEAPETILLWGQGWDPEGRALTFEWSVDLYHDVHLHPAFYVATGPSSSIDVEIDGGEAELYYYRVNLTITDASGLQDTAHTFFYSAGSVRDTTGTALPITRMDELIPPYPLGTGKRDPEVMRDGDTPPVGSSDLDRQFDTFHGGDQGDDDWLGYELAEAPGEETRFIGLLFQEGIHYPGGGWFEDFVVEVREDGEWEPTNNLTILPAYPFELADQPAFDGVGYHTYQLHFDPAFGDALRIRGDPGGLDGYVSSGELRFRLISHVPPAGPFRDLTAEAAAIIAKVFTLDPPGPEGDGNPDPETIRNGTLPPQGSDSLHAQFDTFHHGDQGDHDWIGYRFGEPRTFTRVLFQEGFHYPSGGWFEDLAIEVRLDATSAWTPVELPGWISGDHSAAGTYETFDVAFDPVTGSEIRIAGEPGGADGFVSVGELRVFGPNYDDETCGWTPYGEGLGGANVLALESTTPPLLGFPVVIETAGAGGATTGILAISQGSAFHPYQGGTLLVDFGAALTIPLVFDGAGTSVLLTELPSTPGFAGETFYLQALADPDDLLFSNGLELTICP
ncbi:MAG: PKD domain-containing protein, partial [Planctomycetota bacterium]|nr:PKD domain-containing protein [Planctomycetota bacterium]